MLFFMVQSQFCMAFPRDFPSFCRVSDPSPRGPSKRQGCGLRPAVLRPHSAAALPARTFWEAIRWGYDGNMMGHFTHMRGYIYIYIYLIYIIIILLSSQIPTGCIPIWINYNISLI